MKVKAEISSILDTLITPTGNKIPIIDTSTAETTVMVKEGATVIIGGLKKDSKVETTTQTPFLGSIPILGNLFKSKDTNTERDELLIILTPRIITGEALVASSGNKAPADSGFKPVKEYDNFRHEQTEEAQPIVNSVFIPMEEGNKLQLKGLRQR